MTIHVYFVNIEFESTKVGQAGQWQWEQGDISPHLMADWEEKGYTRTRVI